MVRVLLTGDLHIGRASAANADVPLDERSVRGTWAAAVDVAIERQVDLVAISGDVVDQLNGTVEALGPFERGIGKLAEAGIETVAITGNHDYKALADLVRRTSLPRFRLLGAGGTWERWTLERNGEALLHVDGWSFPTEQVKDSPLTAYQSRMVSGVPVLGMVHGELDTPGSTYAPLGMVALRAHQVDLWLLGHIHKPDYLESGSGAGVLYPGSPQALDFGETGVHGVWIAEVRTGSVALEQVPLSSFRYETLPVSVDGISEASHVNARITQEIRAFVDRAAIAGGDRLRCVQLRVQVSGATDAYADPASLAGVIGYDGGHPRVHCVVDRVESFLRPSVDLGSLALNNDPPGVLARLLIALEQQPWSAEILSMIEEARKIRVEQRTRGQYAAVQDGLKPVESADVAMMLQHETQRLLNGLMVEKARESLE